MLLLAEATGWSETAIHSLPLERRNSYIKELNKIVAERNGEESL